MAGEIPPGTGPGAKFGFVLALFLPIYKIVDFSYLLVTKELTLFFALRELALFCIK
jgi:hypothetical protein